MWDPYGYREQGWSECPDMEPSLWEATTFGLWPHKLCPSQFHNPTFMDCDENGETLLEAAWHWIPRRQNAGKQWEKLGTHTLSFVGPTKLAT